MRALCRMALAAVAALLLPVAVAGTADADSFRFWGYYQWVDGEWAFAATGPAETVPDDGAIEGWRYGVGETSSNRLPRTGDVFEEICGGATANDAQKRVAVVIDYGTAEDAPTGDEPPPARGECAVVPEDATGAEILTTVGEARFGDGGFTCGIDGYPSTDCGGPVDGAAPTDDEPVIDLVLPADSANAETPDGEEAGDTADDSDDDGQPIGLIIGAAAVVLIGVAAILRMRRSSGS